jgi:DNA-binding beta-propeller fold protein YncE
VANFDNNAADDHNVSEINLDSFTVSDSMDLGSRPSGVTPWGVAVHYDEGSGEYTAYVANYNEGTITVIRDGSISSSDTFAVAGRPIGLALSPGGRRLYAAIDDPESTADGELAVIDTGDLTVVRRLNLPSQPWGVAVGSDGDVVYVTQNSDSAPGTVTLYYPDDHISMEIDINAANLMGVAAPKNGDFAYVISRATDAVYKIDSDALTAEAVVQDAIDTAYALGAFIGGPPPAAPGSLDAEVISYDEIQLSWTDNATDELGYKIERRQEDEDTYVQIAKAEADATEYSDDGLQDNTTYEYRVRAYNEAADSDYAILSQGVTTEEGHFSWCFINALFK